MCDPSVPTTELLVEHLGWMRALARQLVAGADNAEDLAQEAMVIALERPPRDTTGLRGWLRQVLRNLSSEQHRSQEARRAREAASARGERLPATSKLVEGVQTQRRIADLLLTLEEPYRTTVLLRFYEDLPPRRIAEQQGVPVATVKSRLNRGLAKLRKELDGEYGNDRKAWSVALAPWVRDLDPVAKVTLGGLALNAKLLVAAGVVAVTGTLYWLKQDPDAESKGAQVALQDDPNADAAARAEQVPLLSSAAEALEPRESVPGTAPVEEASPEEARPVFAVRGKVYDSDGRPVDGLAIRLQGEDAAVTTFGGGVFEFETAAEYGSIDVADEDWIAVRPGSWSKDGGLEPVVVVARAIQLEGRVVNEWGRGLLGARVALALPDDFQVRFGQALDATFAPSWDTACAEGGTFVLPKAPAVSGAELRAVHERFEPVVMDAPKGSRTDLWITLASSEVAPERALQGLVLRADGSPSTDALVSMGVTTVRTTGAGLFTIDLQLAGDTDRLMAVEAGQRPVVMERPEDPGESEETGGESSGWPDFVELVLPGPALTIAGRVVDDAGQPLAGGRVWVGDASHFGSVGKIPLRLEALMAGGRVPDEAIDSIAVDLTEPEGDESYGSASPIFEPNALVYWVETDDEGRFELPGLSDRDYTLHVLDKGLHWGTISDPIAAGSTGVELVIPRDAAYPVLRGRIVTGAGDPLPGVRISSYITALRSREPVLGGSADVTRFFMGPSATTDEDGGFELEGVPRAHVQFFIVSDEIVPSYASVEQVSDPDAFEIQVLARVHLEVEVASGPDDPTAIRVTDEQGEVVTILAMRADGYSTYREFTLQGGRSGVVTVTTDASTLHFLRDGEVIDSVPITPRPGQTLVIRR